MSKIVISRKELERLLIEVQRRNLSKAILSQECPSGIGITTYLLVEDKIDLTGEDAWN